VSFVTTEHLQRQAKNTPPLQLVALVLKAHRLLSDFQVNLKSFSIHLFSINIFQNFVLRKKGSHVPR
jgi:hypothetical protein